MEFRSRVARRVDRQQNAVQARARLLRRFGIPSCSAKWDKGAITDGTLTSGVYTASHEYRTAGVYTIQATVADDDTGSDVESVMVVVYDPSAGFVNGGWIDSPAGAYKPDESLTGKATFGFMSKYQKGASVPTGTTAFEFDLAGLSFASQSYDWLVVSQGGTNAQFKGSGLLNGAVDPIGTMRISLCYGQAMAPPMPFASASDGKMQPGSRSCTTTEPTSQSEQAISWYTPVNEGRSELSLGEEEFSLEGKQDYPPRKGAR